jgi:hypothetical protein
MSVTYTSAVGVPASMALNIVGAKSAIPDSAGIERVIQIEAELEQGSPEIPVTSTLDVAPGQLLGFLNLMPTEVTVSVDSVLIGKGGGLADTILVRPDHWVRLDNVEFIAPARVTIDTSFFENPAESQGNFTDAEARERINANIDSASVTTTIFNQIPVSVGVRLFTGYDPATVLSDPVLTVPKGAGEFFSVAPNATEERRVSLTADDLRLLLDIDPNDPRPLSGPPPRTLYTGVKVRVAAPTGEQVFANDIVVVQAQTEIFIELNESLIQ